MVESVLLDNDIVIKSCSYKLSKELLCALSQGCVAPAILGVARYTIRSQIMRQRNLVDQEGAKSAVDELLGSLRILEPEDREIEFAAELEQHAIELSLELDTGESQLFAILVSRGAKLLITGDKRAIRALELLAPPGFNERMACLEQLMATFLLFTDHLVLRHRICSEPAVDKAITACFSCSSPVEVASILAGLQSYIADLRRQAGRLLTTSLNLSTVIS